MLKEELYSPDGGVMPKKEELYSPDGGVMPSQSAPPAVALGSMPNSGAKLTASVDPRPVSLCKCAMESVQIILLIILISILGTYADCEATRMKTEEQCKNDNDPFSKACMDFRHCNFGGIIIVFMDEVVQKWGVGSGVSLFIGAGIGARLFSQLFQFLGP